MSVKSSGDADDQACECAKASNAGDSPKIMAAICDAEAVDAQDGDLSNTREDRHDHGVGNSESTKDEATPTYGPGRCLENPNWE